MIFFFAVVITDGRESIKVWDVRARSIVYELSTGNNSVESLGWDDKLSTLYAALDCRYVTRMGSHLDYRRARNPKKKKIDDEIEDESEDEDAFDDVDYDGDDRQWPERAFHQENYFEYTFDAGRHGLCQYTFTRSVYQIA